MQRCLRWLGWIGLFAFLGYFVYLPIRRQMLDAGAIPAASFRSAEGTRLVFWDNGTYERLEPGKTSCHGIYHRETFADGVWISGLTLDTGEKLHVRWEDRAYQVEFVTELQTASAKFFRE